MEVITFLFYLVLRRVVLLLVVLAGIGFAFARWKRHPRISLMTVLGLGLYLIDSFAFAFLYHYLPRFFNTLKVTSQNISILDSVLGVCDDFVYAAVLILLVAAAFSQRHTLSATKK